MAEHDEKAEEMLKLLWAKDHKSVILVAETKHEVAFAELFIEGMDAHRYKATRKNGKLVSAEYTVSPEAQKSEILV